MGSRSKARARAQASQPAAHPPSAPRPAQAPRPAHAAGAAQAVGPAELAQPVATPRSVLYAAIVQAAEAAGVLAASILAGIDTGSGRSYERASGIALTLIGIGTAAALGLVARGLQRGRRWSRTPALLTQLFSGVVAIYLLQAGRYDWGIPAVLLAIGGFAALLAPASVETLTPGRTAKPDPPKSRNPR